MRTGLQKLFTLAEIVSDVYTYVSRVEFSPSMAGCVYRPWHQPTPPYPAAPWWSAWPAWNTRGFYGNGYICGHTHGYAYTWSGTPCSRSRGRRRSRYPVRRHRWSVHVRHYPYRYPAKTFKAHRSTSKEKPLFGPAPVNSHAREGLPLPYGPKFPLQRGTHAPTHGWSQPNKKADEQLQGSVKELPLRYSQTGATYNATRTNMHVPLPYGPEVPLQSNACAQDANYFSAPNFSVSDSNTLPDGLEVSFQHCMGNAVTNAALAISQDGELVAPPAVPSHHFASDANYILAPTVSPTSEQSAVLANGMYHSAPIASQGNQQTPPVMVVPDEQVRAHLSGYGAMYDSTVSEIGKRIPNGPMHNSAPIVSQAGEQVPPLLVAPQHSAGGVACHLAPPPVTSQASQQGPQPLFPLRPPNGMTCNSVPTVSQFQIPSLFGLDKPVPYCETSAITNSAPTSGVTHLLAPTTSQASQQGSPPPFVPQAFTNDMTCNSAPMVPQIHIPPLFRPDKPVPSCETSAITNSAPVSGATYLFASTTNQPSQQGPQPLFPPKPSTNAITCNSTPTINQIQIPPLFGLDKPVPSCETSAISNSATAIGATHPFAPTANQASQQGPLPLFPPKPSTNGMMCSSAPAVKQVEQVPVRPLFEPERPVPSRETNTISTSAPATMPVSQHPVIPHHLTNGAMTIAAPTAHQGRDQIRPLLDLVILVQNCTEPALSDSAPFAGQPSEQLHPTIATPHSRNGAVYEAAMIASESGQQDPLVAISLESCRPKQLNCSSSSTVQLEGVVSQQCDNSADDVFQGADQAFARSLQQRAVAKRSRKTRPSLDECLEMQEQENTAEKYALLQLIERNGKEGQFAAVAAILVRLQEDINRHDVRIVETVVQTVTSSRLSPALAFWILVSSYRQTLAARKKCNSREAFTPGDRWMIAQVGIALLLLCEENKNWEAGVQVLFCLHTHGTHYVGQLPPTEPSQELKAVSHCTVVLTALRICLEKGDPSGALEVLSGCGWAFGADTDEDTQRKAMLMIALLDQCADAGLLQDAYMCLECLLKDPETLLAHSHVLICACNKLIQKSVSASKIFEALEVYKHLEKLRLLISPDTFSSILEGLANKGENRIACDLCRSAIARGLYPPLPVNSNDFVICLPVRLCRIEVFHLLEGHLQKLAILQSLQRKAPKPLDIIFSPGSVQLLKKVLSEDIKPSIEVDFPARITHRIKVPVASLQNWIDVHNSGDGLLLSSPLYLEKVKEKDNKIKSRRQFRAEVCKVFAAQLKPYFKQKALKPNADYANLLRTLTARYLKRHRRSRQTMATIEQHVRKIVHRLMAAEP